MSGEQTPANAVKSAIEELIRAGTTFDLDALETVYHDDLQVLMVDDQGKTNVMDKAITKALFQSKRDNNEPA